MGLFFFSFHNDETYGGWIDIWQIIPVGALRTAVGLNWPSLEENIRPHNCYEVFNLKFCTHNKNRDKHANKDAVWYKIYLQGVDQGPTEYSNKKKRLTVTIVALRIEDGYDIDRYILLNKRLFNILLS